jgi:endonuclease/exonuclease/phosphatase family metal-dependent hydrolase
VFGTMKAAHTGHHGRRGSAVTLLVLIVTLLAGACHPLARTSAPAPETLRVMTFNIRAGTDLERRPSIQRLAAFIDSVAPDLVFLQEVDRETRRSGGVDQLGELARLTGMHGAFGRAMGFDGGEYGTGILSRLPLRDTATLALPVELPPELSERYQEPRALLRATVDTPRGPLFLLGTHLDHHGHGFLREPQLLQILAHLAERVPGGAMVLFAGDLNAQPDAAEIRAVALAFHDAWHACGDPAREGRTYPADRPTRRIDYVLMRGVSCVDAVVPDTQLSDHRPVVVELVLAPGVSIRRGGWGLSGFSGIRGSGGADRCESAAERVPFASDRFRRTASGGACVTAAR